MKPYITTVDTVKLQLTFKNQEQQHAIHQAIINYITKYYFVSYQDFTNTLTGHINRVFFIYYDNTYITSISMGIYTSYDNNKVPFNNYYISIKFAGLTRHNEKIDYASNDCLFRLCAFFNSNDILFRITQLDIAIDIYAKFNNVLAVCTKKTPNTHYFSLSEQQRFEETRYIEDIAQDRLYKVSKHAYTYDKGYKEGLDFDLTRFELSLKPKFFSKNGVSIDAIAQALDRYHVMYFSTIKEKKSKINEYESYSNFRTRDIKKIGFELYRLYPDLVYLNQLLHWIFTIDYFDMGIDDESFYIDKQLRRSL